MIKEILENIELNEKSAFDNALGQTMQAIAGDVLGAGLDLADAGIDNFPEYSDADDALISKWKALTYSKKLAIAKKVAKQYV